MAAGAFFSVGVCLASLLLLVCQGALLPFRAGACIHDPPVVSTAFRWHLPIWFIPCHGSVVPSSLAGGQVWVYLDISMQWEHVRDVLPQKFDRRTLFLFLLSPHGFLHCGCFIIIVLPMYYRRVDQ